MMKYFEEDHINLNKTAIQIALSRRFTGQEMRPVPDCIAQLLERFEGGVFDDGFVEAHWLCDFERGLRFGNVMVRSVIHARFVFVAQSFENEVENRGCLSPIFKNLVL